MPIGVIAAGVGAAATIGGALISSGSQRSAANQANQSQQQATAAQLQLGQQNLSQQRDIYNANFGVLSPFVSRGNVAGQNYNALLGLPNAPAMTSPLATPAGGGAGGTGGGAGSGPTLQQILAMQHDGIPGNYAAAMQAYINSGGANAGGVNPAASSQMLRTDKATAGTPATTPATTPAPATQPSAMDAFNNFANSAGMQFQQQQAADGLNNKYAGAGMLQSGAAMKAVPEYLQKQALQNYFMPYMSMLGGQQATGAQAGSALAGVGSNFGNTASSIYGNMGNAIQGGADSASNAALLRGQANSQMWNSIGSGLGSFASSFSDRRLKTNIELVRRDPDGLGWYKWNWKGAPDGEKSFGVIADEVERLRPQAYVPNYRGTQYAGVNYGALGSMA